METFIAKGLPAVVAKEMFWMPRLVQPATQNRKKKIKDKETRR
jgi:hypothetical protein